MKPAPRTVQQRTCSSLRPQRQSSPVPTVPIALSLGTQRSRQRCLESPQTPLLPYSRSVTVSSTPTLPLQDRHNPGPPVPRGSGPPKRRTPSFCPHSPQEKQRNSASRRPLTASSFLRAAALHRPRRPLAWPQPARPPRGPGSRSRHSSSRSGPATPGSGCAVSAPLRGPGSHCLLSAPNPRPRNRRRPTRRRGEATPQESGPDARSGRGPVLPGGRSPLLTRHVGEAGCRQRRREAAFPAHSHAARSPSGRDGGLRAARSRARGPLISTAAGTDPAHRQFAVAT